MNNHEMTTFRIKIGFNNPSALTLRALDEAMEGQQFVRKRETEGQFRYFQEYEYATDHHDYCHVCAMAYKQACKVKGFPLVLVEEIADLN